MRTALDRVREDSPNFYTATLERDDVRARDREGRLPVDFKLEVAGLLLCFRKNSGREVEIGGRFARRARSVPQSVIGNIFWFSVERDIGDRIHSR